jgi:excisionase family DNA binding protein
MGTDVQAPRLLTVRAVAHWMGLSTKQVRRRIASGDLPAVRLGPEPNAQLRVSADELEAWLERRRTQPKETA